MAVNIENNIGYWCASAVADFPERVAIIDLCGAQPREVTYGELETRLNRAANLFTGAGLVAGDRMAMVIGNRFEFVEIMYGAMRAGIVPVPLSTQSSCENLEYILRDAGCRGAAIDAAANGDIADVVDGAGIAIRFALDKAPSAAWRLYEPALARQETQFTPPAITDEHPSFQPYTSGSTGRPKGVVLTHGGQLWWIRTVQK